MSKFEKSFVIIKIIETQKGKTQNVLLVDTNNEILEFDNKLEAENLSNIFEMNSEKGFHYYVREI